MYIEVESGIKLFLEEKGMGEPCLFIHGGPGASSIDFEKLGGDGLESFMQMIYFDQRGSGRSEGAENDDYSIERIIEDIEEIRIALGIDKWNIISHSFGGIIAVNYVYKYEDNVNKLILLSSTLCMEDSLKNQIYYGEKILNNDLNYEGEKSVMGMWQKVANKLIEKDEYYKLQYMKYENYQKVNNLDTGIQNFNISMAKQAFSNKEYFYDYSRLTKDINIPVLVLCGDEDYAIGPEHYKKWQFPNSQVKILKGKHVLYLEDKEKFMECVKEFITK